MYLKIWYVTYLLSKRPTFFSSISYLRQYVSSSIQICKLFRHIVFCPPRFHFLFRGVHLVILFVYLLSFNLCIWPAPFHFAHFVAWTRSFILVCSRIQEGRFWTLSLFSIIILLCAHWVDLNFCVRFHISKS